MERGTDFRVIKKKAFAGADLAELWRYRELFWFLAMRDIMIRYKQTFIGMTWVVIQPFVTMVVLSVIFGQLAKLPSDGVPYPVLVFTALLPWKYFANAVTLSSSSVVGFASIVSKIYFPRIIIPTVPVISGLIDFIVSFTILLGMMIWYGILPTVNFLYVPLFLLMASVTALALGLWLSALSVEFRDIAYAVPFLMQLLLYISPVAYTSSIIPEKWRLIYLLNPVSGIIDGFRWSILGTRQPDWFAMAVSMSMVLLLFISGLFFFRKMELSFADII